MSSSVIQPDRRAVLMRAASYASVLIAISLIVLKAWAWSTTESVSLLSSLADSVLDLIASIITLFAVRFSLTPADEEHRFGHGKSEGVAGLAQALIVFASATYVASEALQRLVEPAPIREPETGVAVMVISLVLTALLVSFQVYVSRRTGSLAIAADEVHYRADLATNTAVLFAVLLTNRLGWYWLDPVIGLVVVGVILLAVKSIIMASLDVLLDRELPDEDRDRIREVAKGHDAVMGVHDLRTRSSGAAQFIQFHLELDPNLTLIEAHEISDDVEDRIRRAFPDADVIIHADPYGVDEPRDPF